MMKLVIKVFAVVLILAGMLLIFYPEAIFGFLENNRDSVSLYITAIGVRLIIGIVLIKSARLTLHPKVVKFLGVVFVIAAVVLLVIGHGEFQDMIVSFIPLFNPYGVLAGIACIAFGGYLYYVYAAPRRIA